MRATAFSVTFAAAAGVGIVGQFGHLWVISPQLLAQAVGQACPLLLQFIGDARPLAQFDHRRVVGRKLPEGLPIGAQRVSEDKGVTAVILGTRGREAITETIELLGIDGKDRKPVLEQHLHHRAMRHLDRHGDLLRCGSGLLQQPIA
jgi:hypothetical protein